MTVRFKKLYLFFLFISLISPSAVAGSSCVLFQAQPPYQFIQAKDGIRSYQGMDVQLLREIFPPRQTFLHFKTVSWQQGLDAIKQGSCDLLMNAFETSQRDDYAYFSKPYRIGIDKFYIKSEHKIPFHSVDQLLKSPTLSSFRLGVIKGYRYSHQGLNDYLSAPKYPKNVIIVNSEQALIEQLLTGSIDGYFSDRTTMDLLLWKSGLSEKIIDSEMEVGAQGIRVMFSKKNITPEQVQLFNSRLKEIKASEKYQQILRQNVIPYFIAMITETNWYKLLEILGTMFYAISGLLLAKQARFSFSGAFILAMLPGIGGGVMRDVLLDRVPVTVFRTPIYFLTVVLTTMVGYLLIRLIYYLYPIKRCYKFFNFVKQHYHARLSNIIVGTDAFGLAAFTVAGVMVAVEMRASPLWLWGPVISVLSSCGGGIVRDFFMGRPLNRKFFYETSFLWSLCLSSYIILRTQTISSEEIFYAVIITLIGIIASRAAILKWGIEANDYWLVRTTKRMSIN